MQIKLRIVCVFFILLCLSISACSTGPSKSEAGVAIDAMLSDFARGFGSLFGQKDISNDKIPHTKVSDLKCSKVGDDMFNCTVLFILDGQSSQNRFRFTKLDGKWQCEAIK